MSGVYVLNKGSERERETETETETETERDRERQTDRQTGRQAGRQAGRQVDTDTQRRREIRTMSTHKQLVRHNRKSNDVHILQIKAGSSALNTGKWGQGQTDRQFRSR